MHWSVIIAYIVSLASHESLIIYAAMSAANHYRLLIPHASLGAPDSLDLMSSISGIAAHDLYMSLRAIIGSLTNHHIRGM